MEEGSVNKTDFIVIGGSSGSLPVIIYILERLPAWFKVPVLLILHRGNSQESMLPGLLNLKSKLTVKEIEEKDKIRDSHVYLSPVDYHVLIEKDKTFSLDYSEKINYSRPSIDVSFISASRVYGKNLTGILLSGGNDDGADGLKMIKEEGGYTIIQDPAEAEVGYMPRQADMRSKIDAVFSMKEILDYLISLGKD